MTDLETGDVIQITNAQHHWFPCLVIVSEVKSFGCQGYAMIPKNDGTPTRNAYIRLIKADYERIGKAVVVAE